MKIPFVTPDIEQAIAHFITLTLGHNFIPILLALAIISTLAWALHKPTRSKILLLVGFSLLLIHFEYVKHIMPALHEQTQVTLTTETPNYRFIWLTDKLINRIVPFGLLISGWGSLITGGLVWRREHMTHESS